MLLPTNTPASTSGVKGSAAALRAAAALPATVPPGMVGGGSGSVGREAVPFGEVGAGWGCVGREAAPSGKKDRGCGCVGNGATGGGADHGGPGAAGMARGLEDDLRCTVLCWVGSDQGRVAAAWPPHTARHLFCIIMAPMSDPGLPQAATSREEAEVRRLPSGAGGA